MPPSPSISGSSSPIRSRTDLPQQEQHAPTQQVGRPTAQPTQQNNSTLALQQQRRLRANSLDNRPQAAQAETDTATRARSTSDSAFDSAIAMRHGLIESPPQNLSPLQNMMARHIQHAVEERIGGAASSDSSASVRSMALGESESPREPASTPEAGNEWLSASEDPGGEAIRFVADLLTALQPHAEPSASPTPTGPTTTPVGTNDIVAVDTDAFAASLASRLALNGGTSGTPSPTGPANTPNATEGNVAVDTDAFAASLASRLTLNGGTSGTPSPTGPANTPNATEGNVAVDTDAFAASLASRLTLNGGTSGTPSPTGPANTPNATEGNVAVDTDAFAASLASRLTLNGGTSGTPSPTGPANTPNATEGNVAVDTDAFAASLASRLALNGGTSGTPSPTGPANTPNATEGNVAVDTDAFAASLASRLALNGGTSGTPSPTGPANTPITANSTGTIDTDAFAATLTSRLAPLETTPPPSLSTSTQPRMRASDPTPRQAPYPRPSTQNPPRRDGPPAPRRIGNGQSSTMQDNLATTRARNGEIELVRRGAEEEIPHEEDGAATPQVTDLQRWVQNVAHVVGHEAVAVGITTAIREVVSAIVRLAQHHSPGTEHAQEAAAGALIALIGIGNLVSMGLRRRNGTNTNMADIGNGLQIAGLISSALSAKETGQLRDLLPTITRTFVYAGLRDGANAIKPYDISPKPPEENDPRNRDMDPLYAQLANTVPYGFNQFFVNWIQSATGMSGAGFVDALHDISEMSNQTEKEAASKHLAEKAPLQLFSYVAANTAGEIMDKIAGSVFEQAIGHLGVSNMEIAHAPTHWPNGQEWGDAIEKTISRMSLFGSVLGNSAAAGTGVATLGYSDFHASMANNAIGGAMVTALCLPFVMTLMKKARATAGGASNTGGGGNA